MKVYKILATSGVLPQSACEALTLEVNRFAAMGYEVCTPPSVNEGDRGAYFHATITMVKND